MSFISPLFPLFLAVSLFCYFISPRRFRWCVLLLASYVFYCFLGGLFAVSAISFTVLSVYASGLWASSLREKKASLALRRVPLALCLTANFGLLAFFKFNALILPSSSTLLIPGISFYSFQAAGYLIDVYLGKANAERNPLKAALFLSFFPQLIQGPISRHSEIAGDLLAGCGWDWERARSGVQRIIWGYFMKLVIANYAAPVVDTVFAEFRGFGGTVIIFAVLIYSIQVYADFAGGINIALGIAQIVGINLPENFRQPFFANSLADFWRRWHITLGRWLRDYLFYSLALSKAMGKLGRPLRKAFGNRAGKLVPSCIATFCVYIVVGVWHGTGRHFPVFGILNGVFISASLFAEPFMEKLRRKTGIDGRRPGFGMVFASLRTFALLSFLRYFARAGSPAEALSMLRHTVFHPRLRELWNGALLELGLDGKGYVVLTAGTIVLLTRDLITERGTDCGQMLNRARPAVQFILILVALTSIMLLGLYSGNVQSATFIYAGY